MKHEAVVFGNQNAKDEVVNDVAQGEEVQVLLQVEHGVVVISGVEPIGVGLAVSVEEAVEGAKEAEDGVKDTEEVRCVPKFLPGGHLAPVDGAGPRVSKNVH